MRKVFYEGLGVDDLTVEDIAKAIDDEIGGGVEFEDDGVHLYVGMNYDGTLYEGRGTIDADYQYTQAGWNPYEEFEESGNYDDDSYELSTDYAYDLISKRDDDFMWYCKKLLDQIKEDFKN